DFHVTGVQTCALPIYAALEFQTLSFTTYATTELGHIPKKPGLQAVSTEPGFRELQSAFNLFKRRGVRVERHRASVEIHRPLHLCIVNIQKGNGQAERHGPVSFRGCRIKKTIQQST